MARQAHSSRLRLRRLRLRRLRLRRLRLRHQQQMPISSSIQVSSIQGLTYCNSQLTATVSQACTWLQ